jgi:hypothetical protein
VAQWCFITDELRRWTKVAWKGSYGTGGMRAVRGTSQIEERPSVGGAHREREKMVVVASISVAPTCLRRPVRMRCKGGSVEVVRDPVAGETVRGGIGGDSGRSTHFIANTAMEEMGGVQSLRCHAESRE